MTHRHKRRNELKHPGPLRVRTHLSPERGPDRVCGPTEAGSRQRSNANECQIARTDEHFRRHDDDGVAVRFLWPVEADPAHAADAGIQLMDVRLMAFSVALVAFASLTGILVGRTRIANTPT